MRTFESMPFCSMLYRLYNYVVCTCDPWLAPTPTKSGLRKRAVHLVGMVNTDMPPKGMQPQMMIQPEVRALGDQWSDRSRSSKSTPPTGAGVAC